MDNENIPEKYGMEKKSRNQFHESYVQAKMKSLKCNVSGSVLQKRNGNICRAADGQLKFSPFIKVNEKFTLFWCLENVDFVVVISNNEKA